MNNPSASFSNDGQNDRSKESPDEFDGLDPALERVDVSLDKPYTFDKTVSGVDVTLMVSEATLRRGEKEPALSAEDLFRDVARATEYTVTANGETVIDGGEEVSVRWLENTLVNEVGATRRVKEELMDSGLDADALDETAQDAESAVVQFYRNIDIKDAEMMAKGIAFNAVDADIDGAEDLPETAEIRQWVNDARNQLDAAEDALDDIEGIARDLLGDDEYENSTLVPDSDDSEDQEADDYDGPTTDIEEIRKQMYDSGMRARMFAEREETLPNGNTLKVETGPLVHTVVVEDEDGNTEQVARTDSEAEAVQRFNETLRERQ